jgi:hypothetical protein
MIRTCKRWVEVKTRTTLEQFSLGYAAATEQFQIDSLRLHRAESTAGLKRTQIKN